MLQQITWQTFLVATLVLTLIWYVAVVLLFYRKEFFGAFGKQNVHSANRFKTSEALPHRWERGVDELQNETGSEEMELMGKSKLPEGIELVESGGFSFGGGDEKQQQLGLIPDILHDIGKLFRQLAEKDGNKKDFFSLFVGLKESYPKMAGHPNVAQLNEFIIGHAPFHLTSEELENLWD